METTLQQETKALSVQAKATPTLYEGNRDLTAADVVHQVRTVQEVMEAVMKPKIHFDTIPGCDKPSLLQPGAEKLAMTFRLAIKPEVEDLSVDGEAHFRVTVEITHIPTGRYVGTGVGECSTLEEKYAWKKAVCHAEYEYVEKRKGPDYVRTKFGMKKRGTYKKDEPDYYTIEQVRANPADLRNTILQMAIKRAVVSGVKRATAASDVFAQNLEDLPEEYREMVADEASEPEIQAPQRRSDGDKPAAVKVAEAFVAIGVTTEMLAEYLGHSALQVTAEEMDTLRNIYSAIKAGEITWAAALEIRKEQTPEAHTKEGKTVPKAEPKPEPMPEPEIQPGPYGDVAVCGFDEDGLGKCFLPLGHDGPHEVPAPEPEPQYVKVIDDNQRRKLFAIVGKSRPKNKLAKDWEQECRGWIQKTYGFKSTTEITEDKFSAIISHFEAVAAGKETN